MPEYLPILQKGDRFKVPERTETLRYLSDYLTSKKVLGRAIPKSNSFANCWATPRCCQYFSRRRVGQPAASQTRATRI